MIIITDSASDIPDEWIKKYRIKVIPMQVEIDGTNYLDGIELSHQEFYEKMKVSHNLPKTSQPSTGSFISIYRESLQEDDEVLSIHMSSKLSGTFNGALNAAKQTSKKIHVFDSLSGTMGTGMMVLCAAKLKKKGYSMAKIIKELESYRKHIHVIGYLDSLENAVKGGRVKPAKGFFLELMKIKPITNIQNGNVEVINAIRGTKKTYAYILDKLKKEMHNQKVIQVFIVHCNAEKSGEILRRSIEAQWKESEVHIMTMGPVNSTHVGFGGISICFSNEDNLTSC